VGFLIHPGGVFGSAGLRPALNVYVCRDFFPRYGPGCFVMLECDERCYGVLLGAFVASFFCPLYIYYLSTGSLGFTVCASGLILLGCCCFFESNLCLWLVFDYPFFNFVRLVRNEELFY